jgi:hypothetical protein
MTSKDADRQLVAAYVWTLRVIEWHKDALRTYSAWVDKLERDFPEMKKAREDMEQIRL